MDDMISFGSAEYGVFLGLLVFARGMDFLSTWIATPNLVLEANPLARKLGWKWGIVFNAAICLAFALNAVTAIVIVTTSLLVAARNFQSAWLMRSLGEEAYRGWMVHQLLHASNRLYLFCLLAQSLLTASVGVALMLFSGAMLVPFAVGMGIIAYAIAVAFYTLLSVWRIHRANG